MPSLSQRYADELNVIREQGLYKDERVITTPQGVVINTEQAGAVLNFCANNYLGLSSHPEVVAAARAALESEEEPEPVGGALLPASLDDAPAREVSRVFGKVFTEVLGDAPLGRVARPGAADRRPDPGRSLLPQVHVRFWRRLAGAR